FRSDPAEPLEVDAGLDGDDASRRERLAGLAGEARRLVDVQPDPVAEPVAERLAEPGVLDPGAGRGVRVDPGHAGADRFDPGELRVEAGRIGLRKPFRERPGREGA